MPRPRNHVRFLVNDLDDMAISELAREVIRRIHGNSHVHVEIRGGDRAASDGGSWIREQILAHLDRHISAGRFKRSDLVYLEFG